MSNDDDSGTMNMEEFMIRKLGGEDAVRTEYLREVAGLSRSGGTRRTLREVLAVATKHDCDAWLLDKTMPDIAACFFVEPEGDNHKFRRRTRDEIKAARDAILDQLGKVGEAAGFWLAKELDLDADALRTKDLNPMVEGGVLARRGKGNEAIYKLLAGKEGQDG